jgi:hypothetical protein
MKRKLCVLFCAFSALFALPSAAQVPAYVPTDGLVGWWPFNGNANDESGNGNDGTVNGATLIADRNGVANAAYSFNGVSSVINVPSSQSLNIADSISISAWLYRANPENNGGEGIFGPSNYLPNSPGFYLRIINQKADLGIASPYTEGFSNQNILGENWYHVIAIYDNSTIKIYINGVLDNITQVGSGNLDQWTSSGDLTIGKEAYEGAPEVYHQFNGLLDDIAIFNRVLTEQEIQALYTGQCPTIAANCTPLPSNLQNGLVGYWPFCGNANDESGNGNDGTVNGAVLTEDRFGNANSAYEFDGLNDAISVAHSNSINCSEVSISAWFNASDFIGYLNQNELVSKREYSGWGNSYEIGIGKDPVLCPSNPTCDNAVYTNYTANNINYSKAFSSNELLESGVWNHMIYTHDADSIRIYLNGALVLNETSEGLISTENTLPLWFGARPGGGGLHYFNGLLDDIAIYNRALTPEEVQELYTLDACTFTVYDTVTTYETVYDTLYTNVTIYDTVTTYVTVTDTLLIDITFVGFEGQPSWLNTVVVYPNPASDHITIHYGNYSLMAGYNTVITDAGGATVYSSAVNSQLVDIDINAWGAAGVYYMSIYDANGGLVAVRHIVLQ